MNESNLIGLPSDTLCEILKHITDYNTINALLNSKNKRLLILTSRCVERLISPTESVLPIVVYKLAGLKEINAPIIIRNVMEISKIATLPNLEQAIFNIYGITNLYELLNLTFNFIKSYCVGQYTTSNIQGQKVIHNNKRDFQAKYFELIDKNKPLKLIIDDSRLILNFPIKEYKLITSQLPYKQIFVDPLLLFFDQSKQYTPLLGFDTLWTLFVIRPDLVTNYFKQITELNTLYLHNVKSENGINIGIPIFNQLKDKIQIIRYITNDITRETLSINELNLLEVSTTLIDFDVPITINAVNLLLTKFPNLKSITLIEVPDDITMLIPLTNNPQLNVIRIVTRNKNINLDLPKISLIYS